MQHYLACRCAGRSRLARELPTSRRTTRTSFSPFRVWSSWRSSRLRLLRGCVPARGQVFVPAHDDRSGSDELLHGQGFVHARIPLRKAVEQVTPVRARPRRRCHYGVGRLDRVCQARRFQPGCTSARPPDHRCSRRSRRERDFPAAAAPDDGCVPRAAVAPWCALSPGALRRARARYWGPGERPSFDHNRLPGVTSRRRPRGRPLVHDPADVYAWHADRAERLRRKAGGIEARPRASRIRDAKERRRRAAAESLAQRVA
jgi:hypothetical protein